VTNLLRLVRSHGRALAANAYLVPAIARSYARLLVERKPTLRAVELALTYRCQCACRHCLKDPLVDRERPEMTPAEVGRAVEGMRRVGLIAINLTGGEALLREDLDDVVAACQPHRLLVTLATNGTGADRPTVRRLKGLGVRMLVLSLDSADPGTHDAGRNLPGVHLAAMAAIEACRAEGMPTFVTTIATPEALRSGDLDRLAEVVGGLGAQLTLNYACPVGAWDGREDLWLQDADRERFDRLLRLPHVRWEGSSNYLHEGCPAGTEKVYLTPYGDVMPCGGIHASYGNVRDEAFEDIYGRMRRTPLFASLSGTCLVGADPHFQREVLPEINRRAYVDKDPRRGVELLERVDPRACRGGESA